MSENVIQLPERQAGLPHSTDSSFSPIVLEIDSLEEGQLEIVAELVEVL